MITVAKYVFDQCRSLLDDPNGSFAKDDYLAPFVQIAQDELEQHVLRIPDLGQLTSIIVLADVPAGTTDLSAYFAEPDGDLRLLTGVITMKERPTAGSRQEQDWVRMNPTHDTPTITPSTFNAFYQFTGDTIRLPGADQTMDLRIYGKFAPQVIKDATTPIVSLTSPILTYGAAALVSLSRGNDLMYDKYNMKCEANKQSFVCNMIMEMQAVRTRLGSFSGRGMNRNN